MAICTYLHNSHNLFLTTYQKLRILGLPALYSLIITHLNLRVSFKKSHNICVWVWGYVRSYMNHMHTNAIAKYKNFLPVTSSVILSLAITDGLVLITTSHWIALPSSVVFNCVIVYESVYTSELSIVLAVVSLILLNTVPSLLHTISTLLVIPLTVVTSHCSVSDWPTVWVLGAVTLTVGVRRETTCNYINYVYYNKCNTSY